MVHSIEAYCLRLEPRRFYVLLIQYKMYVALFTLLSNFVSDHRLLPRTCSLRNQIRSPRTQAYEILMAVTLYNINCQVLIKGGEEVALSEVFNWISSKIRSL